MKSLINLVVGLFVVLGLSGVCFGEDMLIKSRISDLETKISLKGNEYSIITVSEKRNLEGIEYDADIRIMCFGRMNDEAKKLAVGQDVKLIVRKGTYKGEESFTLVYVVPEKKK